MINVEVVCPYCHKSFLNPEQPINDVPSIELIGKIVGPPSSSPGFIRLSSIYGDYTVETNLILPAETIVEFSCPFCHHGLQTNRNCDDCSAPMAALEFSRGGKVQFCSRKGCKKHLIELEDPEQALRNFLAEYSPYSE